MAATIVITRSSARKISGLTGPIATIMTKITTTTTTVTDNDWEVRSAGRSRPAYQDLNRSTRSYLINIRASEIADSVNRLQLPVCPSFGSHRLSGRWRLQEHVAQQICGYEKGPPRVP